MSIFIDKVRKKSLNVTNKLFKIKENTMKKYKSIFNESSQIVPVPSNVYFGSDVNKFKLWFINWFNENVYPDTMDSKITKLKFELLNSTDETSFIIGESISSFNVQFMNGKFAPMGGVLTVRTIFENGKTQSSIEYVALVIHPIKDTRSLVTFKIL
jgi:hypothetical protein